MKFKVGDIIGLDVKNSDVRWLIIKTYDKYYEAVLIYGATSKHNIGKKQKAEFDSVDSCYFLVRE